MKVIFIKRRRAFIFLMIFLLATVSVLYTKGMGPKTFQAFTNQDRQIPIYSVDTSGKKVAISFDAAWGAEFTQEILDILEEYDVKSTFFLVGMWVDEYPEKVKAIHEAGHEIGNHSTSHPDMAKISDKEMIEELNITGKKIEEITGKKPILFRPPFGSYSDTLITKAKEQGYYTIQWDVDSLDWKEEGLDPLVERVTSKAQEGSIILCHNNAKYITQALPTILETLQEEGYEFVPISELIYKEGYYIDHAGKQFKN